MIESKFSKTVSSKYINLCVLLTSYPDYCLFIAAMELSIGSEFSANGPFPLTPGVSPDLQNTHPDANSLNLRPDEPVSESNIVKDQDQLYSDEVLNQIRWTSECR